jgi:hypothetical protein
MQLRAIMRHLWLRYRAIIWDGILLLALMAIATLIAYEYDIFPNSAGVPEQEHVIENGRGAGARHASLPRIARAILALSQAATPRSCKARSRRTARA